jgi:cobalt/nickel transport system permease protein
LSSGQLGGALAALRVPYAIAGVIETMLRQVAHVTSEGRRIRLALELRGAHGSGLTLTLLGALLVRSVQRAERVDLAMRLRGYDPGRAAELARLRASDAPALALAIAAALTVHALPRLG